MNSINILVVDDEIEICNLIKSALKKQGYAVTVRNNAIDISKEELNKFDLILLDVMMPTVDGFTLCRYIRDEVDCPIIFITAKTMEEDILEGFSIGADDYIKKPFSILELRARVEAHLRREHREKQQVLSTNKSLYEQEILEQTTTLLNQAYETTLKLEENLKQAQEIEDFEKQALFYKDNIIIKKNE